MKNLSAKLMAAGIAIVAMTACSENDILSPAEVEQQTKQEYSDNFFQKYADVDLSQGWDFSHKQPAFSLSNQTRAALTRAEVEYNFVKGGWYEIDNSTLDWMHEQLTEGEDNRSLGKPFYMTVPGNEFTIVPIYQGVAGAMSTLHVVVNGVDIPVWSKINGETLAEVDGVATVDGSMQIKDVEDDQWHNLHGQWYDWGYGNWNSLYNTDGGDKWCADGSTNTVTAVRAIPYTFKNLPVGADMYFYLEITFSGSGDWEGRWHDMNNVGAQQSSLKGNMLAMENCPRPNNISADNEVMIIGCEDADLADSDWDLNDIVFLVYGKQVPKPILIEEGTPVDQTKTVRYMIEDLGATDDFDFNDIVVDCSEIRTTVPVYTNGVLTEWKQTNLRQEATIRFLGGTLPFKLTIGDTQLDEMGGPETLLTSPNKTVDITGWNYNTHNISINVQQKNNAGVYNNVTFPKAGEAPMIIAVNPTQQWMQERHSVPSSWFYVPKGNK